LQLFKRVGAKCSGTVFLTWTVHTYKEYCYARFLLNKISSLLLWK